MRGVSEIAPAAAVEAAIRRLEEPGRLRTPGAEGGVDRTRRVGGGRGERDLEEPGSVGRASRHR